jgi:hypothetical protein
VCATNEFISLKSFSLAIDTPQNKALKIISPHGELSKHNDNFFYLDIGLIFVLNSYSFEMQHKLQEQHSRVTALEPKSA